MKLVLIHGRGQEGLDPAALQQEWLAALHEGCARTGTRLPAGTVIEFPFYGDILAEAISQLDNPLSPEVRAKGLADVPNAALPGEILLELAANAGLGEADIQRELGLGGVVEKGPGNWAWVQAILRALDRLPSLSGHLLSTFTRDVYIYLTYPAIRERINEVVAAALPADEPCIVLGHSLGTVVAYEVLRARAATPPCPSLITVGSPLGIRAIRRQLTTPLLSPRCVGHWFNAYDDRDVVALMPLDELYFNVTPPIENKSDVQNSTDNRHGATGYLADPEVARQVVQGLESE